MSSSGELRMNLIAAVCGNHMGIGKNNCLPWRLRTEMKYFTSQTTKTVDPDKKNAVIMGRLNWDSIPSKFKPFKDRINVVLSKTMEKTDQNDQVFVCRSMEEALELLSRPPLRSMVETIWNIGGSSIYKLGLQSPAFHRLYLTRIYKEFDCDVFFPETDWSLLTEIDLPDVPKGIQEENGIQYEYFVYERKDL